ncbi:MAG: putative membrane protein [Rhodothermales bacterium]|jgi:putative membrane protein
MVNANTAILEDEATAISAKIAEIKTHSQAEVVCALATESGRYDRAESIVGIGCALLALLIGNSLLSSSATADGDWQEYVSLSLGMQLLLTGLGFALGTILASYVLPLRRLVARSQEMTREVDRAAAFVFAQQHMQSTQSASGLLIYVSLYERQIRLIADEQVLTCLPDGGLDGLMELALPHLRSGATPAAFAAILDALAEPLAEALPAVDAENELENHLLRFHPRP